MSQILLNGEYKECRHLLLNLNRITSLYFKYNDSNSTKKEYFEKEIITESEPVITESKVY